MNDNEMARDQQVAQKIVVLPAGTWMRRNPGLLVQPAFAGRGDPGDFGERISIDQEDACFR